jgi:hypothetical protein
MVLVVFPSSVEVMAHLIGSEVGIWVAWCLVYGVQVSELFGESPKCTFDFGPIAKRANTSLVHIHGQYAVQTRQYGLPDRNSNGSDYKGSISLQYNMCTHNAL